MLGFHDFLLTLLLFMSIFVGGILLCFWSPVVFEFLKKGNSSDFLEKKNLEVLWTLLPFLMLMVVGVYSLHLLYHTDVTSKQVINKKKIKIMGHQWYWTYDYDLKTNGCRWPEKKDHFVYDSYMMKEQDLNLGSFRKLTVDKPLVMKMNHVYNIRTTSSDVIHSFSIPSLGIKIDSVPGRLKETKFLSLNTGAFFGACSEICGSRHAHMPIQVLSILASDGWFAWQDYKKELSLFQEIYDEHCYYYYHGSSSYRFWETLYSIFGKSSGQYINKNLSKFSRDVKMNSLEYLENKYGHKKKS